MAGIYIHIPFCKRRCIYCDFFSTTQSEKKSAYVRALCRELEMRWDYVEGEEIETIYLGGGTPSQLTEEELKVLMENETMLTPDKALEYGFIDEIAGRKEDVPEGAQQAATDIKELRARMNGKEFSEVLEEFKELNKVEEPKQEVSAMDAFFNAFL